MVKHSATLDSSFWINAHRAGLLEYVFDRYAVYYTPAVAIELRANFPSGREFWRIVRDGLLVETAPSNDAFTLFGPGERAAINLVSERPDWVLLMDDRKPLIEAQRLGLRTLCTPVLVATLFDVDRVDMGQAIEMLGRLTAMQTVSPTLIQAALAQVGLDASRKGI